MGTEKDRKEARTRRHLRVRRKVTGTQERPRLCVYKSLRHIYAQVVDDTAGRTLVCASSLEKELGEGLKSKKGAESAVLIGKTVAERALAAGHETVVFDRAGWPYHGKIKLLAEAAREAGLKF